MNMLKEHDEPVDDPDAADLWPTVLLIGLVTLALGIIVLAWPRQTLTVVSVVIGLQILINGTYRLITAFSRTTPSHGGAAFVGIAGIAVGVVVLRHPFRAIALLALLLGVIWIVVGAVDLVEAISNSSLDHRIVRVLGGLISIVAGVVMVAWPAPTATAVAWVSGLYLIANALFTVYLALQLRGLVEPERTPEQRH